MSCGKKLITGATGVSERIAGDGTCNFRRRRPNIGDARHCHPSLPSSYPWSILEVSHQQKTRRINTKIVTVSFPPNVLKTTHWHEAEITAAFHRETEREL